MNAAIAPCPSCAGAASRELMSVGTHRVLNCDVCGVRFSPVIAADCEPQSAYDALYQPHGLYHAHVNRAPSATTTPLPAIQRAKRSALEMLRASRMRTLLEIGCGNGTFLAHASRISGLQLHGLDVSANALQLARAHLDCPLHCGELGPAAFPGVTFDAVCSWEVLEHVPEPGAWLSAIRSRLVPGGLLMLSTPNYDSSWIWRDMPADPRSRPPVHLTFWNSQSLRRALRASGFSSINVQAVSVPASAARRSGGKLGRWIVYPDALLRASQRSTLFAVASAGA